jgi:hypothetical protein
MAEISSGQLADTYREALRAEVPHTIRQRRIVVRPLDRHEIQRDHAITLSGLIPGFSRSMEIDPAISNF